MFDSENGQQSIKSSGRRAVIRNITAKSITCNWDGNGFKTAALNVQLHYVVYVIGFDIGDVRYTTCVPRLAINAHDTLEHHKRGGIQL